MTEDPRLRLEPHEWEIGTNADSDIWAMLKARIAAVKCEYDNAIHRPTQLRALARMARLKAALAGLEAS